tara:strand:- start:1941 stop:2150 length:210 start_codon:yes stop_codon:yes gene_type:complete
MPDITLSFTDAQWARIVAASPRFKPLGASGDVDAAQLTVIAKAMIEKLVIKYERDKARQDADDDLSSFS